MVNFLEKFIAFLNWLKIVASPAILGLVLAALFYLYKPNIFGICIACVIATLGIFAGVKWANAVRKKMDTTDFNARVMATPELDHQNEATKK